MGLGVKFLIFSPCVHKEMYFEAVRFVHILLDFSQKKNVYRGVLIRGMHARDSWLY